MIDDALVIYAPAFFVMLSMLIVTPVLPLYVTSFEVSYFLASMAISIYAVGRFVIDTLAGMIAD